MTGFETLTSVTCVGLVQDSDPFSQVRASLVCSKAFDAPLCSSADLLRLCEQGGTNWPANAWLADRLPDLGLFTGRNGDFCESGGAWEETSKGLNRALCCHTAFFWGRD
jgi:hypothetical protein